jgi:predicted transcriptional regulator
MSLKLAMPVETLVRDIMHPGVVTIPATATVVSAADILAQHHVQGAPVLDGIGRIIGVVTTTDLTDPRRSMNPDDSIEWVMTRVAFAVREGDPAMTAVRLMVREAIHRVIVVGDAGEPVGIVTPMDVLRAIDAGAPIGVQGDSEVRFVRLDGRTD